MAIATPVRVPIGARLTTREKLVVMVALMTGMFLFALDQSIVATAVPRIVADLNGFSEVGWIFTIYLVSSTVTIPFVGKLSDMFGRRNYLIGGITVFVAASLACGLAPSMPFLIAMRCAQGIGGGAIVACVFATLGDLWTPIERAKFLPLMTGMFTFSLMAGPAIGGFLTDGPGWRWCFYINLPLGALAVTLIMLRLPAGGGTGGRASEVDFIGSALLTIATLAAMFAVIWASEAFGWTAAPTLGLFLLAGVAAVAFVWQERRHPNAVIPLSLFRNLPFVQSIGITLLAASCIFGALPYLPTFVQASLGGSATASGVVIVPRALALLMTSALAGQFVSRTGQYKRVMIAGACCMLVATFLLRGLHSGEPIWHLAVFMGLLGFGEGMVFPISQVVVQAAVSSDEQGVAASSRQFFVQVAQAFGTGIFGLVFATAYLSGFVHDTRDLAAAVPPAVYEEFKDPTKALDVTKFRATADVVRAQPGGEVLLQHAREAQQRSVASAIKLMFGVSTAAAVGVLIVALTLRQIPLRRSFAEPALPPEVL